MATILRTGKFLRLFSGVARNLAASSGNKTDDAGLTGSGLVPTTGLCFDSNFVSQANFSIQNVLPYLGVSDSGHAEDRFPTRLLSTPNRNVGRVTKQEIEAILAEVAASEVTSANANLLSSQALLALRLCGTVLDQEAQAERSKLVSSIWDMVIDKKLPLTVVHYNALLRVHLENKFKFDPKEIERQMTENKIQPDKETFQCFISAYCQDGLIEEAGRVLQTMKKHHYAVNENIFNSLIIGHSQNGDMARAHAIIKVMKQYGLNPSTETYLTLACAYARHGDISAMNRTIAESSQAGNGAFADGEFLELLFVLCEANHKDQVGKILDKLHPETEEFGWLASHLTVRLVNAGHDDVAYNLVQFTVENSAEESGRVISSEFLEQLVKMNTTVSKLLWILKDMNERKIYNGGLENLLDLALKNSNLPLALKLADILVTDGGRVTKKQFKQLLLLAKKAAAATAVTETTVVKADNNKLEKKSTKGDKEIGHEELLACVKIGSKFKYLSPEMLKKHVFPCMENTWPELTIAQLEEYGLARGDTVTAMIEYLVGKGDTEAASTVAGIFSDHVDPKLKFMTNTTNTVKTVCNHFIDERVKTPPAKVEITNNSSELTETANKYLEEDRITELEAMLEMTSTSEATDPSIREKVYTNLMKLYAKHKMIDRAINLSRRLREEQLKIGEVYEILGKLIESQYTESLDNQHHHPTVLPPTNQMPPGGGPPPPPPQIMMASPHHPHMIPVPVGLSFVTQDGSYFYPAYPAAPVSQHPHPDFVPTAEGGYYHPMPPTSTSSMLQPPPTGAVTAPYANSGAEVPSSYTTPLPPAPTSYMVGYPLTMSPPNYTMAAAPAESVDQSFSTMSINGSSMSPISETNGRCSSVQSSVNTTIPSTFTNPDINNANNQQQSYLHRQLKRLVTSGEPLEALAVYRSLESAGKVVNVTETSALIEQLVRVDMMSEAVQITQSMLTRNMHPMPKIFRFLLNKLASTGAVEDINAIGVYLSSKIKKDVSYDNRLCNAYLSAGRGAEFLKMLMHDLDIALALGNSNQLAMLQDRFPRGGAMGLLDNHPELLDEFTMLAKGFALTGYIAPMNVLWTYHFINSDSSSEVAESIWQQYVKNSNQIMFQKVCQVARSTGNLKLAYGLVDKLHEASAVTPGARGIAYSCLLDCLAADNEHRRGFTVLQDAVKRGIKLEDVNRTALMRLKAGMEELGEEFPYTIPPKNAGKITTANLNHEERSLSPLDWSQE